MVSFLALEAGEALSLTLSLKLDWILKKPNLPKEMMKLCCSKCFTVEGLDNLRFELLSNEMTINLYMFFFFMEY